MALNMKIRTLLLGGLIGLLAFLVLGATYQTYYVTTPNPTLSPAASNNLQVARLQIRNANPNGLDMINVVSGKTNLSISIFGNGAVLWADGIPVMAIGPAGVAVSTNFVVGGVISGDGSGLTNLAVLTTNNTFINNVTNNNLTVTNNAFINNVTVTNNAFFSGNARFTSNAYFLNLNFATNAGSTLTIAAGKTDQALATNNNISFTGYSGIDGTNSQPFTFVITNTAGSAAPKFYQFPAGTLMLSSPFTNGVYNTNQGVFSGWLRPGFGTNATWTGF